MKAIATRKSLLIIALVLIIGFSAWAFLRPADVVDYSADVKPIFNKKCISCHGGVKKKAGFSVLFREEALGITESGKPAIIPGDPEHSEMIRRITVEEVEERMPYKHAPLSKKEISILRRWVKQGAKWGEHWAYIPVKQTAVPEVEDPWIKNDIDKFIFEKLEEKELSPSGPADKPTILRRVSLDLIGMLPPDEVAQRFLKSNDSSAYEVLVDFLLASPRYGERWTSLWLDLSRYADTKGYEKDGGRNIWQYRDWLIHAFNDDKPYDQFIKEQIAGDLFPDPTDAQYIATAFHRNSMTNDEGGTDNEEFRVAAVIDRVNTTWETLMGTTFSCVQCHSHPYDPFKHDEYYKFMAYFNNSRDEDVEGEYPVFKIYTDSLAQKLHTLKQWIETNSSATDAKRIIRFLKTGQPAINSTTADDLTNAVISGNNSSLFFRHNGIARLRNIDLNNVDRLIFRHFTRKKGAVMEMRLDRADGPEIAKWNLDTTKQTKNSIVDFAVQQGIHDVYFTYKNPSSKPDDVGIYIDWLSFTKQIPGKGKPGYAEHEKLFRKLLDAQVNSVPIMMDMPDHMARKTHVFERGAWTSKTDEVQAGVPNLLAYAMPSNAPKNRMGLAMWLTDKKNPLVSRTLINRLWEQLFGTGIAETLEDLGTQGIPPTHQSLMDHLSWKLMNDYNWSMKKLLKEMVMSATYRQDSKLSDDVKEKDLFNRYYARGPRIRLSAEQIRDQHLCISGSISSKMYGEPVMPWQPEGIWLSPYNGARWKSSRGEDQYRRAVYTYWKRSAAYPSMIAFDGVQRVVCNARRIRTNTPLQALVTLNDSAYLNMARSFAYRMKKESPQVNEQIAKGYQMMLYKSIPAAKLDVFVRLYNQSLNAFRKDKDATCEMIGLINEHNNPETAALVVVANAMLNLDEVLMKN